MEHILCIRRNAIPEIWLKNMGATALSSADFASGVNKMEIHWLERRLAESDAGYKQLIPYGVLQKEPGGDIACYRRNGSEKRLSGRWSIGIGGHINPKDARPDGLGVLQIAANCLKREFAEETGMAFPSLDADFLGLINEEETSVGAVHLGLVHRIRVRDPDALHPSEELAEVGWTSPGEAKNLPLEHWSRLALMLVEENPPQTRHATATLQ